MRAFVQRVTEARVRVGEGIVAEIGSGLLVYVGFHRADAARELAAVADKIPVLRIFEDEAGKLNRSIAEAGGAVLVVSAFTLYGSTRRGRRPSFDDSAPAERARALFDNFIDRLRGAGLSIASGRFQEHMLVESINDGPVTLLLDVPPAVPGGTEIQYGSVTPQG